MGTGIFLRRWLLLFLLLMVSCTFLLLQIISLKALDSTSISRFRVLQSIRGLLDYRNRRRDHVVWKCLKTFSEVAKQHGIPLFLLHPLVHPSRTTEVSKHSDNNQDVVQSNGCELLCGNQQFAFGVVNSEWQQMQHKQISLLISPFTSDLQEQSFQVICYKVQEPWFDSNNDFLKIKPLITSSCSITQDDIVIELVVFYDRKSYWWHGPSHEGMSPRFFESSGAYSRFPIEEKTVDRIHLRIPSSPDKLLLEKNQSRFLGCNVTNARNFYGKYGRDISPDAVLFKQKALQVLDMAVTALDRLSVRFWLSSGTCLGWFRQCDVIPHSKDVDIGIWIKDYNPRLIQEFEKNGLFLKHRFGLVEDSFELSFRTKEDLVKLDIFFFYEEENYMWNGGTQARTGKKFKYIFPNFTLCWTEFLELKVRVPCETESYIKANYGKDWQVPIKEWNWKESPPNVRKNGQWDEKDWDRVIF